MVNRPAAAKRSASHAPSALTAAQRDEHARCAASPAYFLSEYGWLFDATQREWLRFEPWPAQRAVLHAFEEHRLHILLKARQLGLSWLCVGWALWLMLFEPGSVVLLFSRRDDEAKELLERLRGMHLRLADWLQQPVLTDNQHELALENGSRALSFATTKHSAHSFTASLVIVDEAHFIPWFRQLLTAVKPTIDAGGRLVLLSTVNKEEPGSDFPRLFLEAEKGLNRYYPIFLPWHARPDRDAAWYESQKRDYLEDDLKQEYPATSQEALAPRAAQKRFHPAWLAAAFAPSDPIDATDARFCVSTIPATIYRAPEPGRRYLIAADPAEGSPTSDPSAATLFDMEACEEVAVLHGRFETDLFASYLIALAVAYNEATICPERNNHGHAVIDNIRLLGYERLLYRDPWDEKRGWLSNARNKTMAVDHAARVLREGGLTLHTQATVNELALFDSGTLRAPAGFHDDLAMTVIIALAALRWPSAGSQAIDILIPGADPLDEIDREGGF